MKKASKVFIWLGMIFQFFLIYPIVIGILSLKKINRATCRNDLQTFGIITTLFCSLLGGVFMLCIEDSDLTQTQQTNIEITKEPLSAEEIAIKKKNKRILLLKIFSIIFAVLTFAASIVFFFLTITSVYVPWYVDIDKKARVIYQSSFTPFLIFTIIFLLITIALYYLILKLFKCNKKSKIIACSILSFIYVSISAIAIPIKVSNIKDDLKDYETRQLEQIEKQKQEEIERIERNTLKYTDIKIADLLKNIERYPDRYNNTQIKLEGYVKNAKVNSFDLVFPNSSYYYSGDYIKINYTYDANHPRVLYNDYVVVTGTIDVSTDYYDNIVVKIINATCEVKF